MRFKIYKSCDLYITCNFEVCTFPLWIGLFMYKIFNVDQMPPSELSCFALNHCFTCFCWFRCYLYVSRALRYFRKPYTTSCYYISDCTVLLSMSDSLLNCCSSLSVSHQCRDVMVVHPLYANTNLSCHFFFCNCCIQNKINNT